MMLGFVVEGHIICALLFEIDVPFAVYLKTTQVESLPPVTAAEVSERFILIPAVCLLQKPFFYLLPSVTRGKLLRQNAVDVGFKCMCLL